MKILTRRRRFSRVFCGSDYKRNHNSTEAKVPDVEQRKLHGMV